MFIPTIIVVLFNKASDSGFFFFFGCRQPGCGGGRVVERDVYTFFRFRNNYGMY